MSRYRGFCKKCLVVRKEVLSWNFESETETAIFRLNQWIGYTIGKIQEIVRNNDRKNLRQN